MPAAESREPHPSLYPANHPLIECEHQHPAYACVVCNELPIAKYYKAQLAALADGDVTKCRLYKDVSAAILSAVPTPAEGVGREELLRVIRLQSVAFGAAVKLADALLRDYTLTRKPARTPSKEE